MQLILKYKAELLGMIMGAICGYSYYYFVGCASGTCAITSSPVNSTIYGGIMGLLVANLFRKEKQTTK
jgi:hypothetical protein